jgi:chemotaxis protein CheC
LSFDITDFTGSKYSEVHIEALQEVANIGVGHSATALSELLHRRVDMSIPTVSLIKLEEASSIIATSPETVMTAVLIDTVENDIMLNYLLLFDVASTKNLLKILQEHKPPENLSDLDEISLSILQETGSILLLHVISAINSFTESKWYPSVPQISIDMIGSIIDEVIGRDLGSTTHFLRVQCDIFTDPEDAEVASRKIRGEIFILPSSPGLDLLMNRLYGEGWEEMV